MGRRLSATLLGAQQVGVRNKMNIVKLKSMSLGILKIVSFVVLIFLIERILFLTHGVIPSSFWQKFDGRGLNEPLFFYSI